jgi:hypothetical protein
VGLREVGRVLSSTGDTIELRFGEGRISGVLALLLGASSVLGVLCFHFPEYLTTPELRAGYDVPLLRNLLRGGMLLAVVSGSLSVLLARSKGLGVAGIALTLAAQWLGGANVYVDEFEQPAISFGLDWLVLAANLPVLDMLFGTWIDHPGRWPERYSVVGKDLPDGFLGQHLYPFVSPKEG